MDPREFKIIRDKHRAEQKAEDEKKFSKELLQLWEKYNLRGKPPKKDSPAEARLKEKCDMYIKSILKKPTEVSADGDLQDYKMQKISSSEGNRRQLHNEIAIMIMGEARTNMDSKTAEMVADFACEYSMGCTLDNLVAAANFED